MFEPIPGHDRWLDSPTEKEHLPECPMSEDYCGEYPECLCEELEDVGEDVAVEAEVDRWIEKKHEVRDI